MYDKNKDEDRREYWRRLLTTGSRMAQIDPYFVHKLDAGGALISASFVAGVPSEYSLQALVACLRATTNTHILTQALRVVAEHQCRTARMAPFGWRTT